MPKRLGDLNVTILKPAVSKNNRRYTKENISKAVNRMQKRIASPDGYPITSNVSHKATLSGDVTRTAGYLRSVWQEDDGSAKGVVRLVDTAAGRDVAALVRPDEDGNTALKGMSIFGRWVGSVNAENGAETSDDLEITGVDFTHYPGVDGAGIDSVDLANEMAQAGLFGESVEIDETHLIEEAEVDDQPRRWHVFEDGMCVTCAVVGG